MILIRELLFFGSAKCEMIRSFESFMNCFAREDSSTESIQQSYYTPLPE